MIREPNVEKVAPLPPERLRRTCDASIFAFEVTDDLPFEPGIIGQDRAVAAIRFGLDIRSPGFNIFVMGPTGSGRRTIVRRIVDEKAAQEPVPDDWVYVTRFSDPGKPKAIRLPPGRGRRLRASMERFSTGMTERLLQAFEADSYANAREDLDQRYRSQERQVLGSVEAACQERNCALVRSPSGLYIAPIRDGELLSPEAISQLEADARLEVQQALDYLDDLLDDEMRHLRDYEREVQAEIDKLDREVADFALTPLLDELRAPFSDQPEVLTYLADVREDVLANVSAFRSGDVSGHDVEGASLLDIPTSKRYRVNLFVDNSQLKGAPVVLVERPAAARVFGAVEYDVRYGVTVTDHTMIRAGALHEANGGYLIVDAAALLDNYGVWIGLKHALSQGEVRIESPDGQRLIRTVTPSPEPIPLQVKVVLIGSPDVFYTLYELDDDFGKYFKVQVDFHTEVDRDTDAEQAYGRFIRMLCQRESMLPFTAEAAARVVEYGSRWVDHQERLSAQFGQVADLVRESDYWARQSSQDVVRRDDVLMALRQQRRRVGLLEELTLRSILEDQLIVITKGVAVGQVNALTVVSYGSSSYGVPSRVTARAYVGRGSVIDIHREIDLGGPIHTKGVLTLTGYFGGQYGTQRSLSMEASLSFEQLYEDIEGDSASCAELYALISAVSQIPLRQDLAVTGAVDQYGHVMAIGGVNEKIEGFFQVCKSRGLTGTQGVIIPEANVRNLMVDEEVIQAVRDGQFSIYAVVSVDEGLALLTGEPVGEPDSTGLFPPESVHGRVARRLEAFADADDEDEEDDGRGK
ncbi:MAG: AAA family ATPase [Anaerolineae bacterium]|nr:AAA family ATPase [Anaerolineae bacterium]